MGGESNIIDVLPFEADIGVAGGVARVAGYTVEHQPSCPCRCPQRDRESLPRARIGIERFLLFGEHIDAGRIALLGSLEA